MLITQVKPGVGGSSSRVGGSPKFAASPRHGLTPSVS